MKKYLCLTKRDYFIEGELYKLDDKDRAVKILVRLGYLKEVPMNYGKIKKKEVRK